jgi:hypothetical protein
MKKLSFLLIIFLTWYLPGICQITFPINKALFGVDGELRSGFLVNSSQIPSTSHDWFSNGPSFSRAIIDSTGASYITNRYITDVNFRKLPFFRSMIYPPFTLLDNRLLIDAVYIRDYHGVDSTCFAISNKNGDDPSSWNTAVASNIPDKNDILETYVHVRRAGPKVRLSDSFWFIGGIALDATNGNRYFDFEMYQTDIFYNRQIRKFTGYGPDEGHTSWKFDPVTGAVTTPGDVIFTAEYGGSGIQNLEARIWVHRSALSINSPNFIWGGSFDGTGTNYGYANIRPRALGNFYTGVQNATAAWSGPFQLVRANNSVQTTFDANQFLEFSVNMTLLGLDPISLLGGSACDIPFSRILIKTRSSSSFTAELKDFIGPFDFFNFNVAEAAADIPVLCGEEVSTISVINPLPTSIYTWETPNGSIVSGTNGPEITVDAPGTYIVKQELLTGCGSFSTDTVVVTGTTLCGVLPLNKAVLSGRLQQQDVALELSVSSNENVEYYVLERSTDNIHFSAVKNMNSAKDAGQTNYKVTDDINDLPGTVVYYRIKIVRIDGSSRYSNIVQINRKFDESKDFDIYPNPVIDKAQLLIKSSADQEATVKIFNSVGALVQQKKVSLLKGNNNVELHGFERWSAGIYPVQVQVNNQTMIQKMVLRGKR